jgi:hypothetical protein
MNKIYKMNIHLVNLVHPVKKEAAAKRRLFQLD